MHLRLFIMSYCVFLSLFSFAANSDTTAKSSATPAKKTAVKYQIIPADTYQSFINNWDEKKQPVLYADVCNERDWNKLFSPATVMGKTQKPFHPEAKDFAANQYLIVCRVLPGGAESGKVFTVESVLASDTDLELRYRFTKPDSKSEWSAKVPLIIAVPQHPYQHIVFVENNNALGTLER